MLEMSFAGFEPAFPVGAWNSIEAKLSAQSKKRFVWWHAVAIVAAVAFLSVIGKFILQQSVKSDSVSALMQPNQKVESKVDSQLESNVPATDLVEGEKGATQESTKNEFQNAVITPYHSNSHLQNSARRNTLNSTIQSESIETEIALVAEGLTIDEKESISLEVQSNGISKGEIEGLALHENLASSNLKFNFPLKYANGGRFIVGASVGQAINSTTFAINKDFSDYVHRNFVQRATSGEGLLGSLNVGLMAAYRVRSHWFVFSGLNMIQRKNSVNYQFDDAYPTVVSFQKTADKFGNYPIVGYGAAGSISTNYQGINTFSQVDIPVGIMRETHLNTKWSFMPSIGLNYSIVTASNGTTLDYQTLETTPFKSEWLRKNMVSTFASLGMFRNLGYSVKLGLNLSGNYMITSMYVPGATISPRALSGGLSTQLIWRID